MSKFILFNDERINTEQLMILTDLAKLVLKNKNVQLSFQKFSDYHPLNNKLYVSFKWKHRQYEHELLKSDVLICSFGYHYTNYDVISMLIEKNLKFKKFYYQLFKLFEEFRIKNIITFKRPATKRLIDLRTKVQLNDNISQINVYKAKKMETDLLYLFIENVVYTENIFNFKSSYESLNYIIPELLTSLFNLKTTEDSYNLVMRIYTATYELLNRDMLNDYYYLSESLITDYVRFKKTNNATASGNEEAEKTDDVLIKSKSTESKGAHVESEVNDGANSKSEQVGRDGSHEDQFDNLNVGLDDSKTKRDGEGVDVSDVVGEFNEQTVIKWREPAVKSMHFNQYKKHYIEVQKEIKQLITLIQKNIDKRLEISRTHLTSGRLSKKVINWFLDDQKKLFYKIDTPSRQLDATFSLLVDASYSMHDKLDETKKGIVLFHESLKQLNVKHDIIAFNEDTFSSDDTSQLNIFDYIISYNVSLKDNVGINIETIEPQYDNRDGLAIRIAGEMLRRRSEKQKFLFVFSDGEPSAYNYDDNGIIDTHDAVVHLRKQGIYVINIFLSQEIIEESTKELVKNIYNEYCIFVEGVENLPQIISPLLKKLLLQSMH